jgi:hypothetical protein
MQTPETTDTVTIELITGEHLTLPKPAPANETRQARKGRKAPKAAPASTPLAGPTLHRAPDVDVDTLAQPLDEAATQLTASAADAGLAQLPAPSTVVPFAPTVCLVCQAPVISKAHSGRCRRCWEFFRHTGTDLTPAEVTTLGTSQAQEIISKGLLTATSTLKKGKAKVAPQSTPTPATTPAGPLGMGTGRFAGKPAKPCATCGTTIYGNVTICAPCWKAAKTARQTKTEVVA